MGVLCHSDPNQYFCGESKNDSISCGYVFTGTLNTKSNLLKVQSWSWSYGSSWIHNYLCNQHLLPLKLWVWNHLYMARCTRNNIMWCSLSVTCGRSEVSLGTPVSSTNKNDSQDIPEILLKVALRTITLTLLFFPKKLYMYQEKLTRIVPPPPDIHNQQKFQRSIFTWLLF